MAKAVIRKPKKKVCQFCKDKAGHVDYKDTALLRKFISDRGKIRARRVTGNCVQHQRDVATAVKKARESRAVRDADQAAQVKAQLEGSTFNVKVRAGDGGRLFGAVTPADIAEAIAEGGAQVDKRTIMLGNPIKSLGVHTVKVKVHDE